MNCQILKGSKLFFLLCLFSSCISFKVPILPEPDNQVERIVLCEDIETDGDLLIPVDARQEFTSDRESVICFLQLRFTSQKIELRWKWYSPDGLLQRDTGGIVVNLESEYLDYITAYDRLSLESSPAEGDWTVAVYINDNLVGSRRFKLVKRTGDINLN